MDTTIKSVQRENPIQSRKQKMLDCRQSHEKDSLQRTFFNNSFGISLRQRNIMEDFLDLDHHEAIAISVVH